jgi:ribosome-associated protein
VNKVSTRVSLRWNMAGSRALVAPMRQRLLARLAARLTREGELVVHSNETRSQLQNRAAARVRMAVILREALHEPKQRRATRPTRSSRKRRLEGKQRRSGVKRLRGRPDASD